jgi:hypothetical protein
MYYDQELCIHNRQRTDIHTIFLKAKNIPYFRAKNISYFRLNFQSRKVGGSGGPQMCKLSGPASDRPIGVVSLTKSPST